MSGRDEAARQFSARLHADYLELHGDCESEIERLRAEVERLRRIEAAARAVVEDDHAGRSRHTSWRVLYEALGAREGVTPPGDLWAGAGGGG